MQQTAIDFDAAAHARDLGIERSASRANRAESEWTGQALGMLIAFADLTAGMFLIEQARVWAEARGLPPPPDARAWGAVTRRAAAKRHIFKAGFAPAASSNCSPKTLWTKHAI